MNNSQSSITGSKMYQICEPWVQDIGDQGKEFGFYLNTLGNKLEGFKQRITSGIYFERITLTAMKEWIMVVKTEMEKRGSCNIWGNESGQNEGSNNGAGDKWTD